MAFHGKNLEVNTNTLTPQSADPTNPTEGMLFYADGTSRPEGVYVYKNSNWVLVGSGAGELNFYEQGNADEASVSDFTTGNNATFDGGGTLQGAFSISTTAADIISGERAFKLVLHATPGTSDNDYVTSSAIDIPQGYRGRFLAVKLQYKYNGADDDIKWVVKDQTNVEIISTGTETLNQYVGSDDTATEFTLSFYCPSDCLQLKIGPQVLTHATGSEALIWDDVVVTPNILVNGQIDEIQNIKVNTANGFGSSGTKIRRFTNEEYNLGPEIITYTQDATNGDYFTINTDCEVEIAVSDNFGSGNDYGISLNASSLSTNFGALAIAEKLIQTSTSASSFSAAVSWHGSLSAGDVLRVHSQGASGGGASATLCTLLATKKVDSFLTYNTHSKNSQIRVYDTNRPSGANNIRTFTSTVAEDGTAITYTTDTTNGDTFTINETGVYSISYVDYPAAVGAILGISKNATSTSTNIISLADDEKLSWEYCAASGQEQSCAWSGILKKDDIIRAHTNGKTNFQTTNDRSQFTISKIGSNQLMGVPKTIISFVKDIKTAGTSSGTFTSGAWQTRDLNTQEGNTTFVSLSSNQFVLDPGTYIIEGEAPAYRVANHATRIQNITDATTEFYGISSYAPNGNDGAEKSSFYGEVVITETKTFELQHKSATTFATNGFGSKLNDGVTPEVFSNVKITKLN